MSEAFFQEENYGLLYCPNFVLGGGRFFWKFGYVNYPGAFAVIEHLPQELRDRFTEMREMDLGVQSITAVVKS